MMGELTLDGHLRPIKGVLPIAIQTKESGFSSLIVPKENAKEAAVVSGLSVYGFDHIKDIISFLEGHDFPSEKIDLQVEFEKKQYYGLDFQMLKGNKVLRGAWKLRQRAGTT